MEDVRTWFGLLTQRVYGLRHKIVQNNKFVENGLENWAFVNQITEKLILMLTKRKIKGVCQGITLSDWSENTDS